MPICSNCNKEMNNDAKFCPNCGTPVKENNSGNKREIVFEGTIHKCPNCGEVLNSFVANCPACGFELRSVKNSGAVAELSKKLEEIEMKRNAEMELKYMKLAGWYGTANVGFSPTDEQKISLIKNFPIPNTKEDLYEFLILSKSNIGISNSGINTASNAGYAISNAWKSKFEQAYLKAKLLFKDDERMIEIDKMREDINKTTTHSNLSFLIILLIPFLIILLAMFIPMILFRR